MSDSQDIELEGDTVAEVIESSEWDLVVRFESGKVLQVHDAKWRVAHGE